MNRLPPTGKLIELRGADFIETSDFGVTRVAGYFEPGQEPRQIGMKVLVQPNEVGPFQFGYSVRVSTGNPSPLGAFASTMIITRSRNNKNGSKRLVDKYCRNF
jgi:hypothetical protein